jgi:glucose 1-dehydrogenase
MRLEGKVAIVTGAASGIGKAIALRFGREGARVMVNFHTREKEAREVAREVEEAGGQAITARADVAQPSQIQAMLEQTVRQWGRVDIMVNNAGYHQQHPFLEIPEDVWTGVLAANLGGAFFGSQIAARQMVKQGGGGRIINISSVHEELPMPTNVPYCAAKGGMLMLMRTVAVELAPYGITVNNIAPGAIDTPMDAGLKQEPEKMSALLAEIPLARMGKPGEVASVAVFLASDEAAYVTGSSYFVDGGMLRQASDL